ncbi:NfeD family protein [Leifsonia flava]|uniref:NfeD family protein n=1 Tax=Orlajensenia leifsoniae TaxID=2561933 RepID=A0A4Y9R4A0_9MICO|nr:NfeD family protein [Leifsonia flava]TFV99140.1 NfeD family protein [Leifsonia flava]
MDDGVFAYAWIVWLALILIFGTIETLTLELTFLMIALGSLGGLAASLIGVPWWGQIIVAAIVSVALLAFIRPPLLRALKKGGDPARSNVDALIGMGATIVASIGVGAGPGQAKLANGETWTIRLSPVTEQRIVAAGEQVIVTAIDGATAVVVPVERTHE